MARDPSGISTRTFILHGGPDLSTFRTTRGSEVETRKKRAHRKSRWGCTACKRRKVKCDENVPCANCEKRREPCSLLRAASESKPLTPAASPPRELDPLAHAEARVNLLHMELFHHFTQVTIHTLAFGDTWAEVIQLAFQEEYLMTAVLAVAARHLNILNPSSRHYSDVALFLISKSCSQFREDLDRVITVENRDSRLGASILLHYLSWCDLSFLDSPASGGGGEGERLDLSRDQLFLLSSGVRHVRFLSWQLPDLEESIFGRLMESRRCGLLWSILEAQGGGFFALRDNIRRLYDDPRLRGGMATPPPDFREREQARVGSEKLTAAILWPGRHKCLYTYVGNLFSLRFPDSEEQTVADHALHKRMSFEVAVDRLALIMYASRLAKPDGDAPVQGVERAEGDRLVLSFPLLCFGPFCEMVTAGDSRALALLFLMYRSAGRMLGRETGPWWARERMMVMENLLEVELRMRGVLGVVEELFENAMEDMEAEAGK